MQNDTPSESPKFPYTEQSQLRYLQQTLVAQTNAPTSNEVNKKMRKSLRKFQPSSNSKAQQTTLSQVNGVAK